MRKKCRLLVSLAIATVCLSRQSLIAADTRLLKSIAGTWVLQQAASPDELDRELRRSLATALRTPKIRGFCLRFPWKAADEDFSLIEAGRKIAHDHGVSYSIRFMAGRHTPDRIFAKGCRFYLGGRGGNERVPVPFLADGSPNSVFEAEYEAYVARLAAWCRSRDVRLLHLAWYGQDWAELNHGKEVRSQAGYSYANWLRAHEHLLDIGLKHAGKDLAIEFPFSGYGPLTDAAGSLADHVVGKIGERNPLFFCQANGWGPNGDWGAPNPQVEAAFDLVWQKPICRGQQAIQPGDYAWSELFRNLYENRATYGEVYAPSFTLKRSTELAAEIRKFDEHIRTDGPLLPDGPR